MSTGTTSPPTSTVPPDDRIAHPLERLRGTIRRYVLIDGLLTAGLFVILWFWLGLLLDFGLFKVTTFDWVLDAPKALRVVALVTLGLLLLGILVTRLAIKLNRTFSYPSLALVLEKRYPQLLGDRLITAVELADVDRAREHGFSEEMVRQTIADARERVGQVPLDDVFNWRRLKAKGVLLAVKAVGTLLVVFAVYAVWTRSASARDFAWQFGDVSGIWAERNLLLRDTPWPRRAYLELVGFPPTGRLRVGKDAPPPRVRVRAYRWVMADRTTPHGWRPVLWRDLSESFVGIRLPTPSAGNDGKPLPADSAAWDADRVEAAAGEVPDVRKVFDRLDALAAKPTMSRTLRKLAIPRDVTLSYNGVVFDGDPDDPAVSYAAGKTRGTLTLTPEAGNEFSGEVAGLKESVRFTARGEDFITEPRTIVLEPPPLLARLTRTEYQPAYLYHPPPFKPTAGGQLEQEPFAALKGLRQLVGEKDLSLTGDKSVFSVVNGTEVVIRGTADKPLKRVLVTPKLGKVPGLAAGAPGPLAIEPESDERTRFTLAFRGPDRPAQTVEFELTLVDRYDVTSHRSVLIQVVEDQPPQVELAVDVLRKVQNAYLVTPAVTIPFLPDSKVRDDAGLSNVQFVLTYSQVETPFFLGVQAQALAGLFAGAPAQMVWPAVITPTASATLAQRLVHTDRRQTLALTVGRFAEAVQALGADTPELLAQKLARPADPEHARVVKEVRFQNPQVDFFDLLKAVPKLAEVDATGVQPRYRMELNVLATDTNVETGPKTGQNLEPIRLLVVSEADLLMEISKDEENLIAKVDEALKKLRDAQTKLGQTADRLNSPEPPQDVIISAAVRAQDIAQDVAKARDLSQGVLTEYRRLYREAQVNRCSETLLKRYENEIISPLQGVVDGAFVQAEQAHTTFQTTLAEGRKPDQPVVDEDRFKLAEVLRQLTAIRDKLGEVLSINKLRDQAQLVLNNQRQVRSVLKRIVADATERLNLPVIQPIPVVEVTRGRKKLVKQPLDWGTFSGDVYKVRFEATPDGGLRVPGEQQVADDKNEIEYEITAGDKAGEFPVKVIPSVGQPVTVVVRVK